MKKTLLCAALLVAMGTYAQDFEWQWAKTGGGIKQSPNENDEYNFDSEQVIDIAVDQYNNYYYLTFMTEQETTFDGTPVTVYNSIPQSTGSTDVVLISTDCQGNLRWTQTIGGGTTDYAYRIQLDNNGGLYIAANVMNFSNLGPEFEPPHFSPDDAMGDITVISETPNEDYKVIALLKYNTSDGSLAWRVMPQGDVGFNLRQADIQQVERSSDGTLHTLIGFRAGTHLNGNLTVPASFTFFFDYYIVKFDADGNYLSNIPLSMEGFLLGNHTDFRYDENLDRYYVAGFRTNGDIFSLTDLKVNGVDLEEQAYILAFSNTGEELWRKEIVAEAEIKDNRIYGFEIDSDSNLYFSGKYFVNSGAPIVGIGSYQFPHELEGNTSFVLKMNSAGVIQWITTPTAYTNQNGFFTGANYFRDIVINGDELAIAGQITYEAWGDVSVTRPENHLSDPGLLRLDKNTGQAIAVHDINAIVGFNDGLTAVAVDNDGNYIVGGYFYYNLFDAADDNVPTVFKPNSGTTTDFFMAKLATGPCSITGVKDVDTAEVQLYPNPSSGLVYIQTDAVLSSYKIINVTGQVVAAGNFESGNNSVSIQNLANGMYIINITAQDNSTTSKKIIKE